VQISGWDVAAALAKAFSYAATLGAAGAIFLLAYGESLLSTHLGARIRRWVRALSVAAIAASGAKVLLLAGSMSGDIAGMFDASFDGMILRAGEGWAIGVRLAGLCLSMVALMRPGRGRLAAVLGGANAATSFAWTGHVHALPDHPGTSMLLMLHLVCAAFWLGALAPLFSAAGDADPARSAALARRFGNIALWLVALLVAAGAVVLAQLLGSVSDLWRSDYGRLVSLKIALVAALLACAALNKLWLAPALATGGERAAAGLRRSIAVEMGLAAGILLVTAFFTSVVGPDHGSPE
jgi:putative copper export protein